MHSSVIWMIAKDIQHTSIKFTDSLHWAALLQSRNKQIPRWKGRHETIKRKLNVHIHWLECVDWAWKSERKRLVTDDILNSDQPLILYRKTSYQILPVVDTENGIYCSRIDIRLFLYFCLWAWDFSRMRRPCKVFRQKQLKRKFSNCPE